MNVKLKIILLSSLLMANASQANWLKNSILGFAGAYSLAMGITAVHELGHALAAKAFYDEPIDITLGASPAQASNRPTLVKLGGIKLVGFNPATGFAYYQEIVNKPKYYDLKQAALYLAGPIFGAVSSGIALKIALNNDSHPLIKLVAAIGLFNHTLGGAGLAGLLPEAPKNHDLKKAVSHIKAYRKQIE